MGLSTALSAATDGLRATSRMVEITSSNVANALTEGYGKRSVDVTSDIINGRGAGVRVTGITRAEDVAATTSRRAMSSVNAEVEIRANTANQIAFALGEPGQTGALANRLAALESALIAAKNEPSAQPFLDNGVSRAKDLTKELNRLSLDAQAIRQRSDADIEASVQRLNDDLVEIQRLNIEITKRGGLFGETAALVDTRQRIIDSIAETVPVRVIKRQHGAVALFTPEGATLIDSKPVTFEFNATNMITPDMTFASGALSGITGDGKPLTVGSGSGILDGSKLGALFNMRDNVLPEYNAELDAIAQDLVERFQDPAVDTTLAAGDPGLFTDNGAAFDPLNVIGFAGRITVNTAVDPSAGGETWRLRDGMNATAEGLTGLNTILSNMADAIQVGRTAPPGLTISGSRSAAAFAAELTSQRAYDNAFRDEQKTYTSAQLATLRESESARTGVDTDEEMANLLQFEQAYAANARVISVVDGLLQRLLEI